jgi:hypothetical protein
MFRGFVINLIRKYLTGLFYLSLLSSCMEDRQGYYLSPNNANSNPYHPIPLHSDSVRNAIYINGGYYIGAANYFGFDQVSVGQLGIHRSNNFGHFQAYYGADLSLGAYNIANFYNCHYHYSGGWFGSYPIADDTIYHISDRGNFFGSYGVSGGINIVKASARREWRALGIEISVRNEFGNYSDFRKSLPDSAANVIFRRTLTATLGFYTDMIWKNRHHTVFGFKFSGGFILNSKTDYSKMITDIKATKNIFPLTYFSPCFHITKEKITGFFQFNLGSYADGFQTGFSFRLGKK